MTKALLFVKLDFMTVKPYFSLKNLIIFTLSPLIIVVGTGETAAAVCMFMMFAALYVSYPFVICEKNNMDALYPTLAITRKTAVLGRYLFSLAFDICAAIMACIFSFVAITILEKEINFGDTFVFIAVLFVLVSLVQAIQLPVYFKLGYSSAKLLAYLPFIVISLGLLAINRLAKGVDLLELATGLLSWTSANPIIAIALGAVIWLGVMVISYQASLLFYSKRDF